MAAQMLLLAASAPALAGAFVLPTSSGLRLSTSTSQLISSSARPSTRLTPALGLKMGLFDGMFGGNKDDDEPAWMGRNFKPKTRSEGNWDEFVDQESGYKYYYNTATFETLWEWEYSEQILGIKAIPDPEPEPVAAAATTTQRQPARTGGGGGGLFGGFGGGGGGLGGMFGQRGTTSVARGKTLDASKLNVVWKSAGGSSKMSGGFGSVWIGTYDARTNPEAVRKDMKIVVKLPSPDPDAVTAFQREGEINKKIAGFGGIRGVADFLGTVDLEPLSQQLPSNIGSKEGLVWMQVPGKTLDTFFDRGGGMSPVLAATLGVKDSAPTKLSTGKVVYIKTNLARAVLGEILLPVAQLHKKGIIHRDLKPQNIMLAEKNTGTPFQVIDFGSAVNKGQKPFMDDISEIYAPPEAPYPENSNPEGYDIYTIGIIGLRCLLPSLVSGQAGIQTLGKVTVVELPEEFDFDFRAWVTNRATTKVSSSFDENLNNECAALLATPDLLDLLSAMLSKRPADRPSAEECLRMLGPQWAARLEEQAQGVAVRGICGVCGQPVFETDLGRVKDAKGNYYHGECYN